MFEQMDVAGWCIVIATVIVGAFIVAHAIEADGEGQDSPMIQHDAGIRGGVRP